MGYDFGQGCCMNLIYCPRCRSKLRWKSIDGAKRRFCDSCEFIYWNNPIPTTSIIVLSQGKVLLLKRAQEPFKNYWVLPGGYIEYNEDPREAVQRELKEETGVSASLGTFLYTYLIDNDPRGNSIDIVFDGVISGGKIRLKEHTQYKFFELNKLPRMIAYKHRKVIDKYLTVREN